MNSTAVRAATKPAANMPPRSTVDWPKTKCASLTPSIDSARPIVNWRTPMNSWPPLKRPCMQSEKLASMGQLAAGIAHEVNNPLGIVLMYAHLLMDDFPRDDQRFDDIRMIAEQADRCKNIVGGLLHFARQNKVVKYATDIAGTCAERRHATPHSRRHGTGRRNHHERSGSGGRQRPDRSSPHQFDQQCRGRHLSPGTSMYDVRRPAQRPHSVSATPAPASPKRTSRKFSSRSSPPSNLAKAQDSVCPCPTGSSRCTAATSRWNPTPIPPRDRLVRRSPCDCHES